MSDEKLEQQLTDELSQIAARMGTAERRFSEIRDQPDAIENHRTEMNQLRARAAMLQSDITALLEPHQDDVIDVYWDRRNKTAVIADLAEIVYERAPRNPLLRVHLSSDDLDVFPSESDVKGVVCNVIGKHPLPKGEEPKCKGFIGMLLWEDIKYSFLRYASVAAVSVGLFYLQKLFMDTAKHPTGKYAIPAVLLGIFGWTEVITQHAFWKSNLEKGPGKLVIERLCSVVSNAGIEYVEDDGLNADANRVLFEAMAANAEKHQKAKRTAVAKWLWRAAMKYDKYNAGMKLAALAVRDRSFTEAIDVYDSLLQDDSGNSELRMKIGDAYMRRRSGPPRKDKARRTESINLAVLQYAKAAELQPDNIQPHIKYASALLELDGLDTAAAPLKTVLTIDPDNIAALELEGRRLRRKKAPKDQVATIYARLEELNPGNADARQYFSTNTFNSQ